MERAFLGFLLGMLLTAGAFVLLTRPEPRWSEEYDSAAAPEAAPISDPSEPPEPAPRGELGEGVFRWVPGHWEEIEPLRPVDHKAEAERAELVRVLQAVVDAEDVDADARDQLISDLFQGKIDACEGWTRLERARNPKPPKADERKPDPVAEETLQPEPSA